MQKPDDGTLDMDKFERIVRAAERSGATVELDVSLRPGSAGVVNGVQWDTGIEVTGRFRWTGKGADYVDPTLIDTGTNGP